MSSNVNNVDYLNQNRSWMGLFQVALQMHPDLEKIMPLDKKKDLLHEDHYWKALKNKDITILHSDEYLIKNAFNLDKDELSHYQLKKLFTYLQDKKNILLAGGYPTIQFLGLDIDDYSSSDIDLYILNNKDQDNINGEESELEGENQKQKNIPNNSLDTFHGLIEFLDQTFKITKIYSHTDTQSGVFNIYCQKLNRVIQIIGTHATSVSEIFNSFDSSYCKCGLYMGSTYVAYDTLYTKSTKTTMFYWRYPKKCRVNKACKMGLKIYGHPEYIYDPDLESGENPFQYKRSREGILRDFTPVKTWINEYSEEMITIPIRQNAKYSTDLVMYYNLVVNSRFMMLDLDKFVYPSVDIIDLLKKNINYVQPLYRIRQFPSPIFTTDIIEMKKGGIMSKDCPYYSSEHNCSSFFIPIGKEFGDESIKKILDQIDKLTEKATKKIFKEHFPKSKQWYQSLVRKSMPIDDDKKVDNESNESEESEESDNDSYENIDGSYHRIKIKLLNNYDADNKSLKINVDVIKNNQLKQIETLDDLRNILTYGCKAKFELYIKDFWILKREMHDKKRMCGYSVICKSITIVE